MTAGGGVLAALAIALLAIGFDIWLWEHRHKKRQERDLEHLMRLADTGEERSTWTNGHTKSKR